MGSIKDKNRKVRTSPSPVSPKPAIVPKVPKPIIRHGGTRAARAKTEAKVRQIVEKMKAQRKNLEGGKQSTAAERSGEDFINTCYGNYQCSVNKIEEISVLRYAVAEELQRVVSAENFGFAKGILNKLIANQDPEFREHLLPIAAYNLVPYSRYLGIGDILDGLMQTDSSRRHVEQQ